MASLSSFVAHLAVHPRWLRWIIAALVVTSGAWAHFPFSYSAAESIGLVQTVFPPGAGVSVVTPFPSQTEYDYLRLQPFVPGYTWHYRGTIDNTRVTLPAELKVEVVSASSTGAGANLAVEYTVRHAMTLGSASAVTTISGVVTHLGDTILTTQTDPTGPGLPSLERDFPDGGLLGMPRRLAEERSGMQMAYARMSELVSGELMDGLGSQMAIEFGGVGNVTTDLGTFETLSVSQTLKMGSLNGVAPVLTSDGRIHHFPRFVRRPPDIRITSAYAMDVGPVRIAWKQSEPQRETVTGVMQLVATNFPTTPRPLRQPQLFANPEPRALEPGSSLALVADVIGIPPGNWSDFSAPSSELVTDSAGTEYCWTTPRGERWTRSASFYLESVTMTDAGNYRLKVITSTGTVQSIPVPVMITPPAVSSRLINVASRAPSGHAADTLIAGIVLSPSPANASATRRLLFRAVGPALRDFGISDAETDPTLVIYDFANREIARCDDWDRSREVADRIAAAMTALGTFPLQAGSRDAALALDLAPGAYTAHLLSAGAGTPSVGLVEIYDANAGAEGPRIANLSTRCRVGTGEQILIPGIVVADGSARLLVRALGPALAQYGITDALPDPEITLYADSTPIAYNNDWSAVPVAPMPASASSGTTRPTVVEAAQLAGAAPLNRSKDAALVVTLPPGSYTLHVRSRNPQQTGVVMAEVFLLNL